MGFVNRPFYRLILFAVAALAIIVAAAVLASPKAQAAVLVDIEEGDTWRYLKGTSAPPSSWASRSFSDSSWAQGPSGFGFGDGDDGTVLSDMRGGYSSVYIRHTFNLGSAGAAKSMYLTVDYDDAFVAYINGIEVARANIEGLPPAHDALANVTHEASSGEAGPQAVATFNLSGALPLLVTGANVLAIQGHNVYFSGSDDFSLIPTLQITDGTVSANRDLIPDMVTIPPFQISVVYSGSQKRLRFSNETANNSSSALEIAPFNLPGGAADCNGNGDLNDDRLVLQRIFQDRNGDGVFQRGTDFEMRTVEAGCMVFHAAHSHWHFDDFNVYRLRNSSGSLVVQSGKQSSCVEDTEFRFGVPGAPSTAYYDVCGQTVPQGISAGWGDIYRYTLPDQYVVVTGLPNGEYCLESQADPHNRLVEQNDSNNTAFTRISMTGDTVTVLSENTNPCTGGGGGSSFYIYDDTLKWSNWSWRASINTSVTSPVHNGSRSMSVTITGAWGALSLQNPGFNTGPYSSLTFAIRPGGQPLSALAAGLYNSSGSLIKAVDISDYASPGSSGWYQVNFPLSALNAAGTTVTRVTIQDDTGAAQPTFHIDDLGFIGGAVPTPTPTPTPSTTFQIYDDTLKWSNWSWRTTLNTAVTSPVYAGSRSVGATFNSAWAGMSFQNSGFNTSGYSKLVFAIRPGGQSITSWEAVLHNSSGTILTSAGIASFATAQPGGWYWVEIPVSVLGGSNTTITRVTLMDTTGSAQPTFHIDNMGFAN